MPVRPTLELSADDAAVLLNEGLVGVNRAQMQRRGPNRPKVRDLITAGKLRYSRVDPNERWQTYEDVLAAIARDGFALADCEDIASMVAAELELEGDTGARTSVYRTGPRMNHVVVQSPRYGLMDPSISAGMGWNEDGMSGVTRRCPRFGCVPPTTFSGVDLAGLSPRDVLFFDLVR
jgi:hypothetical protein